MKKEDIIDAAIVLIGSVVVVKITIGLVTTASMGISNLANKVIFNRKIKKGLKDGSIVKIDGKYYEVEKVLASEEA